MRFIIFIFDLLLIAAVIYSLKAAYKKGQEDAKKKGKKK